MSEDLSRKWWPAFLLDECMRPGRDRPEAWLEPGADGVTAIDWHEPGEGEDPSVAGSIKPGQPVDFIWCEARGSVVVRIMPDGTWSLDDRRDGGTIDMFDGTAAAARPSAPPPMRLIEDANLFCLAGDHEVQAESMDAFAYETADMDPPGENGVLVEVDLYRWSDHIVFTVSADGKSLTSGGGGNG